jgi:hypothetical protein
MIYKGFRRILQGFFSYFYEKSKKIYKREIFLTRILIFKIKANLCYLNII